MDLYSVYMPDVMSYTSLRSPIYRDYERQPYEKKYPEKQQPRKQPTIVVTNGKNCPFCKEQKRRPLGLYMKGKANQMDNCITEEHEHQEEHETEPQTNKTTEK